MSEAFKNNKDIFVMTDQSVPQLGLLLSVAGSGKWKGLFRHCLCSILQVCNPKIKLQMFLAVILQAQMAFLPVLASLISV